LKILGVAGKLKTMRRAALDERAIAGYSRPLPGCAAGLGAGVLLAYMDASG
jgi:hypothetical protein